MKLTKRQIEYLPISAINTDETRMAAIWPDYIEGLYEAMKSSGYMQPLVVNSDYKLLAGYNRICVAHMMQWSEVPCVVLTGLTDEQEQLFSADDNAFVHWIDDNSTRTERQHDVF